MILLSSYPKYVARLPRELFHNHVACFSAQISHQSKQIVDQTSVKECDHNAEIVVPSGSGITKNMLNKNVHSVEKDYLYRKGLKQFGQMLKEEQNVVSLLNESEGDFNFAVQAIVKYLDLSESQAKALIWSLIFRKNNFGDTYLFPQMDVLDKKIEYLLQHFEKDDILNNFHLICHRSSFITSRIEVYTEAGIKKVYCYHLKHFRELMYCTADYWKQINLISKDDCVLDNFVRCLGDYPQHWKKKLRASLGPIDQMTMKDIKNAIIRDYLKFRIGNGQFPRDFKISLSLTNTKKLLDFIESGCDGITLSSLRYTQSGVLRNWDSIIGLDADDLIAFEKNNSHFFPSRNIRYLIVQSPNIFKNCDNLKKKYQLFEPLLATNKQLFKSTLPADLLRCSEKILASRIEYWIDLFGDRIKESDNLIKLLRYHTRAMDLRMAMKGASFKRIPLDTFFEKLSSYKKSNQIYPAKMFNRKLTWTNFANQLELDCGQLTKLISVHPKSTQVDVQNGARVYHYLANELKVDRKYLMNSMYVILYDYEDLKRVYESLPTLYSPKEYQEWIQHPNLIDLLIYLIEKETNFDSSKTKSTKEKSKKDLNQFKQSVDLGKNLSGEHYKWMLAKLEDYNKTENYDDCSKRQSMANE